MGKTLTTDLHDRIRDPNRRDAERLRAGLPGKLWLDIGWRQVICENVSRHGAGFKTFAPELTFDDRPVRLTLQLPQGEAELNGRLVHRRDDQIGIEFEDLTPETRAQLERAIPV